MDARENRTAGGLRSQPVVVNDTSPHLPELLAPAGAAEALPAAHLISPDRPGNYVSIAASASGGTGRRAGFRILWGNPWGFESPLAQIHPQPAGLPGWIASPNPFPTAR